MGIAYYVSGAIVLCFTLSTVSVISDDTSVNCTTFDNNTCCNHVECFYVNCTNKTDETQIHLGCYDKTDKEGITAVCKNGTDTHICDGPADIAATGKQNGGRNNDKSASLVIVPTCEHFEKNLTECCRNQDIGCIFVNCNGTAVTEQFDGCYNSSNVTCTSKTDQCKATTTVAPTTLPYYKECQTFTDVASCCTEKIWSCIYVNCTEFQGCYSKSNETDIKQACSDTYLDACAPTTPVPSSTTTAPSTGGNTSRNFDAASFIGGIVLCAGIVLIIFFALKWYKSRQASNNYHQM